MDFSIILEECLDKIASGESTESCLTRYPEHARELAPLLAAAEELRTLSTLRLSHGQRLASKVALRRTLAGQREPMRVTWWSRLGVGSSVALAAMVILVGVLIAAVASSKPDDFAYPARVVVERVPVWVQLSNQGRATAELDTAERRLQELTELWRRSGILSTVAIDSLVGSTEAAVQHASGRSVDERAALARRVSEQVDLLIQLAQTAPDPDVASALREASRRLEESAMSLREPVHDAQAATPTAASVSISTTGSVPASHAANSTAQTVTPSQTPVTPHLSGSHARVTSSLRTIAHPSLSPTPTPERLTPDVPLPVITDSAPPLATSEPVATIEPRPIVTSAPEPSVTPQPEITPMPAPTSTPEKTKKPHPPKAVPTTVLPTVPTANLMHPPIPTRTVDSTSTVTAMCTPATPTPEVQKPSKRHADPACNSHGRCRSRDD